MIPGKLPLPLVNLGRIQHGFTRPTVTCRWCATSALP